MINSWMLVVLFIVSPCYGMLNRSSIPGKLVRTKAFYGIPPTVGFLSKDLKDTSIVVSTHKDFSETSEESEDDSIADFLLCSYPSPHARANNVLKTLENEGYSPIDLLRAAVMWGRPKLISKTVIKYPSINLDVRDENLATPLHDAVLNSQNFIAKFLISKGARWDILDCFFRSALMVAIINNQPEIVEACVDSDNGDINHRGLCGWTSLHFAAIEGRKECVDILLRKNGIDTTLKDFRGKTAYEYAVQRSDNEIVDRLYDVYEKIALTTDEQIRLPIVINRLPSNK